MDEILCIPPLWSVIWSPACGVDSSLFFRHLDMAEDITIKPDWKKYLDTFGLRTSGCLAQPNSAQPVSPWERRDKPFVIVIPMSLVYWTQSSKERRHKKREKRVQLMKQGWQGCLQNRNGRKLNTNLFWKEWSYWNSTKGELVTWKGVWKDWTESWTGLKCSPKREQRAAKWQPTETVLGIGTRVKSLEIEVCTVIFVNWCVCFQFSLPIAILFRLLKQQIFLLALPVVMICFMVSGPVDFIFKKKHFLIRKELKRIKKGYKTRKKSILGSSY